MTSVEIHDELKTLGSAEKAVHLAHFFKTGKGQYGEGDLFIGVTVPEQRKIARKYIQADFGILGELITSPWHEMRLTALLILVEQFHKSKDQHFRRECVDFYLSHTAFINNWDLVDLSCYKLLGVWLTNKDRSLLSVLAASPNMWEQRIAMVTCMHFVRQNDFTDCTKIADRLLNHPHDLIHKAVGWLLREMGKKDKAVLIDFLQPRYQQMPRTMLRYAIEHFPEEERQGYLKIRVKSSGIRVESEWNQSGIEWNRVGREKERKREKKREKERKKDKEIRD